MKSAELYTRLLAREPVERAPSFVLSTHDEWKQPGLKILQEPADMGFGFTFVAEDPDGHCLRPFFPAERPR